MSTFKKILFSNKPLLIFIIIYFILRLFILNLNYTEWGDTFRMIRAADYLTRLSWPWDEKRWPFYSILLTPGVFLGFEIIWGRLISIIFSVASIIFSYLYYLKFASANKKYALFNVIMLSTSSVFAYWSIRVMADLIFGFCILLFIYYFQLLYKTPSKGLYKSDYALSILLLVITMTRLEGLFLLIGVTFFFYANNYYKKMLMYLSPQVLLYLPFTFYAKFLYKGPVANNYFDEAKTFVFDTYRFIYFFTYTYYILVIPVLAAFLLMYFVPYFRKFILELKIWLKTRNKLQIPYYKKIFKSQFTPLVVFILLELLVGLIWTPSLPRIYMPLTLFFTIFVSVYLENLDEKEHKIVALVILVSTLIFAVLQYSLKLYFLGASSVLFIIIVLFSLGFAATIYYSGVRYKLILRYSLILVNILISATVIFNQHDIYKSVARSIEFIKENTPENAVVAYSDETGLEEWYLRGRSVALPATKEISEIDQINYFRQNNVKYVISTNEFNRGSSFKFTKDLHEEVYKDQVVVFDLLSYLVSNIVPIKYSKTIFETRVYRVY